MQGYVVQSPGVFNGPASAGRWWFTDRVRGYQVNHHLHHDLSVPADPLRWIVPPPTLARPGPPRPVRSGCHWHRRLPSTADLAAGWVSHVPRLWADGEHEAVADALRRADVILRIEQGEVRVCDLAADFS